MSELITQRPGLSDFRWQLLATVSALSLLALTVSETRAEDVEQPTVWIELGGQFDRLQNSQEIYSPPFLALTPSNFPPPQATEHPPRHGFDENGSIVFQPEGSTWHFSAALRYGRASSNNHTRHQTHPSPFSKYQITPDGSESYQSSLPIAARFTDADVKQSEGHTIVDFEAGKDIGLGLFGAKDTSSLNVGIRFAQFQSKSRISLRENPDWHFSPRANHLPIGFVVQTAEQAFHSYAGYFSADRSFRGVGPSVSWSSSAPLAGNAQSGELTLDFGMNGAVLFGRQKTKSQHHETGRYHPLGGAHTSYYPSYPRYSVIPTRLDVVYRGSSVDHTRSHSVIVPNIGAFVGLSVKYPSAKVSFGYKADFFFGAMDGGIDVRRTEDIGFHGPYASVSIGLGG